MSSRNRPVLPRVDRVPYNDTFVDLPIREPEEALCQRHELVPMHHLDAQDRHYCPTGFVWCVNCFAVADEPEPYQCTLWGEPGDGTEEGVE